MSLRARAPAAERHRSRSKRCGRPERRRPATGPVRRPDRRRWLIGGIAAAVGLAPLAATAVVRGERVSHLGAGDTASEYWDIVAHFDSDHDLFARFLITNEGPGERTAIATWQLIGPKGKRTEFRNGRREKRWTLSANGDRIEIGSSIFDQSEAVHRLEYDSTKRGIRVAFEYAPSRPLGWAGSPASPYPFDLLELGTPVTGTIWLEGMREVAAVSGTISITHTWMEASESDLALRRIEFFSTDSGGPSVYLSDRTAPSGERERWLFVAENGELLHQTNDFQLGLGDPAKPVSRDYPTPSELRIRGPGIEGAVQNGAELADVNPLEAIPQPFRFLLSFKLRPHRVWARASFKVRLLVGQDTPEAVLKGSGITTVTFTNPLPPKIAQPGN